MASHTTQWILELVDKLTAPMKNIIGAADKAAGSVGGVGDKADDTTKKIKGMSAIDLFAIKDAVGSLADKFNEMNAPGAAFNAQLKDVEAITGVTGDALDDLGDKARNTAKVFGGDASDMMASYKGILSKLGPDVAESQEALEIMGNDVAILSKTMSNDATGAMDALTGSVLQFAADVKEPIELARIMTEQMNVMAASAREGSAEVPDIAQSIKEAGKEASNAKMSFIETNAAIQALGRGTIVGSEAGIGLRNMLVKMAGIDVIPKEAASKLEALGINYDIVSDKSRPFIERLKELKKAQADATLISQIFGGENAKAVNTLLDNIDYQEKLQQKITGTNSAVEQADVVMGGYNEKMERAKAWFSDLAIGAFDVTSKIAPMMDGLSGAVGILADMSNAKKGVSLLFTTLKTMPGIGKLVAFGTSLASGGFAVMSASAKTLGIAIMNIPILGWIAAIVAALIALGVYFYKTSATFRGFIWGIWEAVKTVFGGIGAFIGDVLGGIHHLIKGVFNPANWFDDDYKFADGLKKISDAASKYGSAIGESFKKGKDAGMEDFYAENPDQRPGAVKADGKTATNGVVTPDIADISPVLKTGALASGKLKGGGSQAAGLSGLGGGSSSIKNINQKIDMKNYFTISSGGSQQEVDSIAEKVVKALNDKLRDGMVAVAG